MKMENAALKSLVGNVSQYNRNLITFIKQFREMSRLYRILMNI